MNMNTHILPTTNTTKISELVEVTIGDALAHSFPKDTTFNMIYFDPPFNSDRVYTLTHENELGFKDKWTDTEYESFITQEIDRLFLLLSKDGTLFFHISSSEMFIPEKILRSKFKFVEPIFWKKCRSKNNVKHKLGSTIDIIFKCNKIAKPKFNVVYQDKNAEYLQNSFNNKDDVGNYALGHIVTEKTKKGYIYEITLDGKTFNPASGWRIKQSELQVLIDQNRIHVPKKKDGNLYKKIYLSENPGKPCTDLWDDIHSISQGNELRNYPTAKPIKLLERLISISTNENDVVYDPMCGSGTTGEACNNLGRRCVLNDINPDVVAIIQSRIKIPIITDNTKPV
jgi:adenine-specific DNA-methyltransferase